VTDGEGENDRQQINPQKVRRTRVATPWI
jgi:hypothetical protein